MSINQAESEINRLADYILGNYPERIGGGYLGSESAVDTAIKLLEEYKPVHTVWVAPHG